MAVDARTAEAVAALARLRLAAGAAGDEERERVAEEFGKIVGYMDILNECDTAGVEPLYCPLTEPRPPRDDVPREGPSGAGDWILEDAPETFGRFFCVPKVL
ncbi:MAG: Asp-tRNA(Asn)/Glu-tRNA(Gln) amidotransferase subunit GatC [Deltaproteobacteria bacterium]|jgi:aspartyl-tRNA(Asn)/glutamyl-tRNA(Gln) amidotransferase subunit C|nr:Asp-tRNA(Asn)/Glu-tRNA(Gln) amidotransferase subunit GatC [Deltaproteobacteria bacterium]